MDTEPKTIDRGRLGPQASGLLICDHICYHTQAKCTQPAIAGHTRCRHHGGMTKSGGLMSAHLKGGRYSKFLPAHLREAYERGLADDELLSLREELALMKARISELTERLVSGEGTTLWKKLEMLMAILMQDFASDQDKEVISRHLESILDIIDKGNANEYTWLQIQETLDGTAKIASAEWKRLVDMRQMITADKAVALVMAVVSSVQTHVKDRTALRHIQHDVSKILMKPGAHDPTLSPTDEVARQQQQAWQDTEAKMDGTFVIPSDPANVIVIPPAGS